MEIWNHINFQHFWLMQLITIDFGNLGKRIYRAISLDNNSRLDKILIVNSGVKGLTYNWSLIDENDDFQKVKRVRDDD